MAQQCHSASRTGLASVKSRVETLQFADENTNSNRGTHPNDNSSTIYSSQDIETPNAHRKTTGVRRSVYTMEQYSAIKREWKIVIGSNMNAHGEYLFSCCCYLSTLYILYINHLSATQFINIFSYFAFKQLSFGIGFIQ